MLLHRIQITAQADAGAGDTISPAAAAPQKVTSPGTVTRSAGITTEVHRPAAAS